MDRENYNRDYRNGYRDSRTEAWNNGRDRRDDRDSSRRDSRDMNYGSSQMNYGERGREDYREDYRGDYRRDDMDRRSYDARQHAPGMNSRYDDRQHMPGMDRRYDSRREELGRTDDRDRSHHDYGGRGGNYGDIDRDRDSSRYGQRSESDHHREQHMRDDRRLDAGDFREYKGRDAGFSWEDGSNPTTWRDMDRWGDQYSNYSRHEGIGWNRGNSRNQNFLSSERD